MDGLAVVEGVVRGWGWIGDGRIGVQIGGLDGLLGVDRRKEDLLGRGIRER